MPLGTYTWRGAETRYLEAFAYEEVTVGAGQAAFNVTNVGLAEFGFLQVVGGPIRALWYPNCTVALTNNFGFLFFNLATTSLNRLEMKHFLATLDANGSSGKLAIHYYAPPVV
jgi:hypothetical protein